MREYVEPDLPDAGQQCWDPDVQMMPGEQLRELQERRIKDVVERVFERPVPLFRNQLERAGFESPKDFGGIADLNAIPTIQKQDLRDSESAHPPLGDYRFIDLSESIRLARSTGTTGTPTLQLYSRRDVWVENECAARGRWRGGVRPGMVVTTAHPGYLYSGGLNIVSAMEHMGCLCIWVPPPDTDELAEEGIRMWQRIPPDVPLTSFAVDRFKEVANKLGLDPEQDLGLTTGVNTKPQGGFPLVTAGAECHNFLGSPCDAQSGAHLADDYALVQAVDPETGREVPDGEWGNMVVTTFGRDSCLIRYDLEEACRIDRAPCTCGETSSRGWWGGRFKDLLAVQGTRVWIMDIEAALGTIDELRDPVLSFEAVLPESASTPLHLRVEAASDPEPVRDQVREVVRREFNIDTTVEVVPRDALRRYGYKINRIVDN